MKFFILSKVPIVSQSTSTDMVDQVDSVLYYSFFGSATNVLADIDTKLIFESIMNLPKFIHQILK